eukprot:scaffold26482_cov62-Phaeocystis_antarctica.AAC.2
MGRCVTYGSGVWSYGSTTGLIMVWSLSVYSFPRTTPLRTRTPPRAPPPAPASRTAPPPPAVLWLRAAAGGAVPAHGSARTARRALRLVLDVPRPCLSGLPLGIVRSNQRREPWDRLPSIIVPILLVHDGRWTSASIPQRRVEREAKSERCQPPLRWQVVEVPFDYQVRGQAERTARKQVGQELVLGPFDVDLEHQQRMRARLAREPRGQIDGRHGVLRPGLARALTITERERRLLARCRAEEVEDFGLLQRATRPRGHLQEGDIGRGGESLEVASNALLRVEHDDIQRVPRCMAVCEGAQPVAPCAVIGAHINSQCGCRGGRLAAELRQEAVA